MKKLGLFLLSTLCFVSTAQAIETEDYSLNVYGNISGHYEYVDPDKNHDSYTGIRDSYSTFKVDGHYDLNDKLSVVGKVVIPLDPANMKIRDSAVNHSAYKTARLGIKHEDYGSIHYGKQLVPYYKAIPFATDRFTSYYFGWSTYSAFKEKYSIGYRSPQIGDFQFNLLYTDKNVNRVNDPNQRYQATIAYTINDDTKVNFAYDDNRDNAHTKVAGASVQHSLNDSIYLGAKYERVFSERDSGPYMVKGDTSFNVYGSYTQGKHKTQVQLGKVENKNGNTVHFEQSYQTTKNLKLFAVYYYEQEELALSTERDGYGGFGGTSGGGSVYLVGFKYDFKLL